MQSLKMILAVKGLQATYFGENRDQMRAWFYDYRKDMILN
jgi:hypothetical protein